MEDEKILTLLTKIIQASEKKKINWEKNPKSESSFKAQLGNNTLHIVNVGSNYSFIILNEEGDQIGSISNDNFTYFPNNELEELYKLARRKALKIDENLDELGAILDNIL